MITATPLVERIPPQSMEAEQAALGAMLLERDAVDRALEVLLPEDFYREAHQTLFCAMRDLAAQHERVDLVTLGNYLRAHEQLEAVGGAAYLTDLMRMVPSAAGIGHYAGIIRARALQRNLIRAADAIMADAYRGDRDLDDLTAEAERRILAVTERDVAVRDTSWTAALTRAFDVYDKADADGNPTGIAAPWLAVNRLTGLWGPGQLVIVAGRQKSGKTMLVTQWAVSAALQGIPGAFASLEMTMDQIAHRAVIGETGLDANDFERWGSHDKATRERLLSDYAHGVEGLWGLPLYPIDQGRITITELDADLRRLKRRRGIEYAVVDLLHYVEPRDLRRGAPPHERVGQTAIQLAQVARTNGICLIATAQLNRESEKTSPARPQLRHVAESDTIGQAASKVLALYRPYSFLHWNPHECRDAGVPDTEAFAGLTEVLLLANRTGPTGATYLMFRGEHATFRDLMADEWAQVSPRGRGDA